MPADLESFWTTAGFALIQGYGMTETTALVTLNHPFKIARGSIGKPLPGREVKIGADGEILVRGGSIAAQEWRNGRLQPRAEEWLATGDLATRNDTGELIFTGRKSDVIVTSAGLNIHPQDLEAVLHRQPGLRDALIVAYDSTAGPTPAAVLIAGPDQGDELLKRAVDAANGELAAFQQIRYWLRWPQAEFPRTSTGKVLRRVVQSWAQQSLAGGNAAVEDPSDPLLAVLRSLGTANREITSSDRLIEDLHLDSLAMVQLQSTLETRFGMELDDAAWEQVRTVGDLRGLSPALSTGCGWPRGIPKSSSEAPAALPAVPRQRPGVVFPRWPWWPVVRLVRIGFLELVARPLIWLVLAPRIGPPVELAQPSLLIANHLTAFDVPVILYALRAADRDHVAVAMSGEVLSGWRRGKAQRHRIVAYPHPYCLLAGHRALQRLSTPPRRRFAAKLRPRRGGAGPWLPRAGFSRGPALRRRTVAAVRAGHRLAGGGIGSAGATYFGGGFEAAQGREMAETRYGGGSDGRAFEDGSRMRIRKASLDGWRRLWLRWGVLASTPSRSRRVEKEQCGPRLRA